VTPRRLNDVECSFSSTPLSTRDAREFVAHQLQRVKAAPTMIADFELMVSELVANAVQHGDGGDLWVRLAIDDRACCTLTISSGLATAIPPIDPSRWGLAPAHHSSGRGLGIVRRLAHEVRLAASGGRLEITCRQCP